MKFISLFAGIGGFDLGLERAGMQCVGQVEINPFCQRVLAHHWPHVKRIGDIHDVNGTEFGAVDLICGGVPCQPASTAGKRRGTQDHRWLWPEAFRVVRAIKPCWCLFENVRGILTLEQGVVFESLLSELEGIGYEVESFIIPACAVDAPHRRERVWLIANSMRIRLRQHVQRDGEAEQDSANRDSCGGNVDGLREDVANTDSWGVKIGTTLQKPNNVVNGSIWLTEPGVGRVVDGVPGRVDRLRSLGNAVVPQVVEVIGRAIQRAHIVCAECAPENASEARFTTSNSRKPKLAKSAVENKL